MHFLKNLQKQQMQQARPSMPGAEVGGVMPLSLPQQPQQVSPSMVVSPNGPSPGKLLALTALYVYIKKKS
jgi:hypothetical protein